MISERKDIRLFSTDMMNSLRYRDSKISTLFKTPCKQIVKRVLYGSITLLLLIYVLTMLLFLGVVQQDLPTTTSSGASSSFTYFIKKPERNPLLTFYGHEDLLKSVHVFQPSKNKISRLDYQFTISSVPVCPPNSQTTLFIMVLTQHEHYKQRKAIRDTWGRISRDEPWPGRKLHGSGSIRMMFLLGQAGNASLNRNAAEEAKIYKDIIQADFKESYFNLTLKVLMGMKWIQTYCPNTQFVMKMDEDVFIDIPRILNILVSTSMKNTIYGPYSHTEFVERNKASKAAVSFEAYPPKYYPPHVKGNLYVMPYQLAMNIMNVSEYFPYVNIEDAHITGILAKVFDARHINIPEQLYDRHPNLNPDLCGFAAERIIAAQGIEPPVVYNLWNRIQKSELCGFISVEKIAKKLV